MKLRNARTTARALVRQLKILDYVALLAAIAVTVFFSFAAAGGSEGQQVNIESEEGNFVYPLNEDRELTLEGPLGTTDIEIRDGRVRVVRDPGPQQICVRQGWIERSGEWLACLPSRIFVQVTGANDQDIDAQTF